MNHHTIALVFILSLFGATSTFADCTTPAAVAGTVFYNTSQNVAQFCASDDKWYNMGEANTAAAEGDCTNPAGKEGELIFNNTNNTMQFCNGEMWKNVGNFNWPDAPQTGCSNPVNVAGAMFYNSAANGGKGAVQFCNGSAWINALDYRRTAWDSSAWSACSATCGGGTQTRTTACKDHKNVTVADSACLEAKPALSQACNTQACLEYVFNDTVSGNTTNYNLKSKALAGGWNGTTPLKATITVASGGVIGSTSTSAYGFDTGSGFPVGTTLSLVINSGGYVVGKGGDAGTVWPVAAGAGGPALHAQYALSINNNGTIGGGGGGGSSDDGDMSCAVGGGGAGYLVGQPNNSNCYANAQPGTLTLGGAGTTDLGDPDDLEAWGGDGGNLGAQGDGHYHAPAGAAVTGNANITWVSTGTRLGPIN